MTPFNFQKYIFPAAFRKNFYVRDYIFFQDLDTLHHSLSCGDRRHAFDICNSVYLAPFFTPFISIVFLTILEHTL